LVSSVGLAGAFKLSARPDNPNRAGVYSNFATTSFSLGTRAPKSDGRFLFSLGFSSSLSGVLIADKLIFGFSSSFF
jgi:hypothetical protein